MVLKGKRCALLAALPLLFTVLHAKSRVSLWIDKTEAPVAFAASEIARAIQAQGDSFILQDLNRWSLRECQSCIILSSGAAKAKHWTELLSLVPMKHLGEQSYALRHKIADSRKIYVVLGSDAAGAMYGGLDMAEAIRLGGLATLEEGDHAPYITKRGLKFNIPLDLRTPSYSDASDSFQANIPEVWNREFWDRFLNEMARYRYNVLTLWNLHPFPSIVKVPEYPQVALQDVLRTKVKFDASFSHSGSDMFRPAMMEKVEVIRKMDITEKVRFWREVMRMAADRGIEVYWFTWNIFAFGAEGKYGITCDPTNQTTIDYFRKSVRETVLTYPLLAGMGITAGEQMPDRPDKYSKEKWLWMTYGEGVRDALQQQPGRSFRLIHRYHQTGQGEILREWKDYPSTFEFSFKYAIAHMYSMTDPPFIKPLLSRLPPGQKTWLTVRNDDIYSFRWGDPDFAREFILHMPPSEKIAGFYMGPDGYCWGREFIDLEPERPRQLVMEKQWYSFLLWGRLSYDPTLSNGFFENTLARRFPQVSAAKLYAATAMASRIIPQATRFFWGDIDIRWFPEACKKDGHFYNVEDFIRGETMPESGILTIRQWRKALLEGRPMSGITPPQVAENQKDFARRTLALIAELQPHQGKNKELRLLLADLEAMAHLGNYYAEKILGSCQLALYDKSAPPEKLEQARIHLTSALQHWKSYAAVATRQYKPQLLNRVGYTDLHAQIADVAADIEMAAGWKPGTIPDVDERPRSADNPFRP